jgi:hypothetical protein
MALDEARERRVIRPGLRCQHPAGDVVHTPARSPGDNRTPHAYAYRITATIIAG